MPEQTHRPVLILGAEPRIAVPIARSLNRRGIPVDVARHATSEPYLRSRAIANVFTLPETPERFRRALLPIIQLRRYDLLVPATDVALAAAMPIYDELSEHLTVAAPRPTVVDGVLNKSKTLEAARACGIRAPITCAVTHPAEIDAVAHIMPFPCVVKPMHKPAPRGLEVRYATNPDELRALIVSSGLPGWLVQEYCPGHGIGVELLMREGQCVAAFQHRRITELPVTGGVGVVAVAEPLNPKLAESALRLLRALQWEGVAMVEFRQDPATGSAALIEVNGRYWGTLALAIQAGVDFPYYAWQLAQGLEPAPPASYDVGMRWRWSAGLLEALHGALIAATKHGHTWRTATAGLAAFAQSPTCDALWSANDPWPALIDLKRTIKRLALDDWASVTKYAFRRSPAPAGLGPRVQLS